MKDEISISELVDNWNGRSAHSIAIQTAALVRAGVLPVGAKLPSVRDLASAFGVSPATISAAWSQLRRYQVIEGRGRHGMRIASNRVAARPLRFDNVGNYGEGMTADLRAASPDPALLPSLQHALHTRGLSSPELNRYSQLLISPELKAAIAPTWPYPAEAFMAVNGGYEGLQLAVQALMLPGSTIAVEDPSTVRILDLLDHVGAHVIPVASDVHGPLPSALERAVERKPAAFIYQPHVNMTTGTVVSTDRQRKLADILRGTSIQVIEDDGLGDLAAAKPMSLGAALPEQTVHIRSYSKAFGPDLRMAVLSGSAADVEKIQSVRNFGSRWTSRILQSTTAALLSESRAANELRDATQAYAQRRSTLIGLLHGWHVDVLSKDGLALWVPVESESFAMVTLAARGIAVTPGSRYCVVQAGDHVRVGIGNLPTNFEYVAHALGLAARIN